MLLLMQIKLKNYGINVMPVWE